jgi:hypothetical protein
MLTKGQVKESLTRQKKGGNKDQKKSQNKEKKSG